MMDWDDLRLALAVGRAGSLSAAGRTLGVDKATVGRRVAALEDDLGLRLFDRTRDGLVPTVRGARVLQTAEKMGAEASALSADLVDDAGVARVTVRVTAP